MLHQLGRRKNRWLRLGRLRCRRSGCLVDDSSLLGRLPLRLGRRWGWRSSQVQGGFLGSRWSDLVITSRWWRLVHSRRGRRLRLRSRRWLLLMIGGRWLIASISRVRRLLVTSIGGIIPLTVPLGIAGVPGWRHGGQHHTGHGRSWRSM